MSSSLRTRSSSRNRRYETSHSSNSSTGRILPISISPERGIDEDYSRREYPPSSSRSSEIERQPRSRRRSFSDNSSRIPSSSQTRSRHGEVYSLSESTEYPPSSSTSGLARRPARMGSLGPASSRIPMRDQVGTDVAGLAMHVADNYDSTLSSLDRGTSVQSPRARRPSQSSASTPRMIALRGDSASSGSPSRLVTDFSVPSSSRGSSNVDFGLGRTSSPQDISPIRSGSLVSAPLRTTLPTRSRWFGPGQGSNTTRTSDSTTGYSVSPSGGSRYAPVSSAAASSSDFGAFFEGSSSGHSSRSKTLPTPARNIAPSGQRLRPVVNNPADYPDNPSGYSDQMSPSWSHFKTGTQLDRDHEAYKNMQRDGDTAAGKYDRRAKALPVRSRSRHATGAEHGSTLDGRNYIGSERELIG